MSDYSPILGRRADGTPGEIALDNSNQIKTSGGGGGPVTIADGADVTQGAKGDAAITDSTTTNTLMSFTKGFVKILADVWDSVNHRIKVDASGTTVPVSGTFWQATQPVQLQVKSSGGSIPYHNLTAASTNFTNVKGAACQMYSCRLSNTSGTVMYVKFYDKATTPATTDVPKDTMMVNGNSVVALAFPEGMQFSNGFGWAATGGVADSDNTATSANNVVDFSLSS